MSGNERKSGAGEDLSATLVWTPGPGSRATCQLGRRIGAGGFAEVFEAELCRPQQPPVRVALKRLLAGLRGDPLRQRQLRREAQIAAYLNHPNIVKVLSLIELGDEVALAMELVEGVQCNHLLHRLAQRGLRLRLSTIAHIACGLYAALTYLENPLGASRPLVHADISLENLMLTADGSVKLIDFGIATEGQSASTRAAPDVGSTPAAVVQPPEDALTSLHQAAGKRPYLPPEGVTARGPTAQSDLYAAGVCFWELCTGCRFPVLPRGIDRREMGSLIAFAADGMPEPAWRLLKSCLSIDPAARVQSAAAALALCRELSLAAELEQQAALGQLVRAAMHLEATKTSSERGRLDLSSAPTAIESQAFLPTLLSRLQGAFCAHRVLAYAKSDAEPVQFSLNAECGQTTSDVSTPSTTLLAAAFDSGFLEGPDGTLYFRVRPPGARALVICVQPGASCIYDELAQSILRNLLCPTAR